MPEPLAGHSPIQEVIFEALVQHEAREKRYGYDLVDKLVEALNDAGYSIMHDATLAARRDCEYHRGYRNACHNIKLDLMRQETESQERLSRAIDSEQFTAVAHHAPTARVLSSANGGNEPRPLRPGHLSDQEVHE